ncbi:MAG: efflux RND transporter permease subunit [Bacteroidia bacterium]
MIKFLLQLRYLWIALIGVGSIFFAYHAQKVEILQDFVKVIPEDDEDYKFYQDFQRQFGEDASTFIIGIEGDILEPLFLQKLRQLCDSAQKLAGIHRVLSLTHLYDLIYLPEKNFYRLVPLYQDTVRALKKVLTNHPIYEGIFWDTTYEVTLIFITLDSLTLHSQAKHEVIQRLQKLFRPLEDQGRKLHFGGVPYLRSYVAQKLPKELLFFLAASIGLTAFALGIYYRSWYATIFPLMLVGLSTLWTLGIIGLYGFKLSLLTALLPPILVILSIPPSIYMLSEYHREYLYYRDKVPAIRQMLRQLLLVTFMIHANTAFGFLTLYFTQVRPLQEFGLVAFWGTMASYLLTVWLLPSVFMLLPPPKEKYLSHLAWAPLRKTVHAIAYWVLNHRKTLYLISGILILIAVVGVMRLEAVSYMADDLPSDENVIKDLRFFETRIGGIMPFEIILDTGKPQGLRKWQWIQDLDSLQQRLARYPEISRTLSIVDALKWTRQAFWGGSPQNYALPLPEELPFLLPRKKTLISQSFLTSLVDSSWQKARITGFVQDIGSKKMPLLLASIQKDIKDLFGQDAPKVHITGTTLIFLKAIDYLVDNLIWSLLATFTLVAIQMFFLYGSWRVLLLSIGVNILPLFFVAGAMGYLGIPLKPSTALIYELAFGIVVDNAIHLLSFYRWAYKYKIPHPTRALQLSILQTGSLIIYVSLVLGMGFGIFALSDFGSTQALGILTAVTLGIGIFSNLFLLPALLRDWLPRV